MQKLDSIPKICKSFGAYLQVLPVSAVPACGDWNQRETTCGLQFLGNVKPDGLKWRHLV